MNVLTHEKTIKVHTLQINDYEVERFLDDPDALADVLRDLLTSKPKSKSNSQRPESKSRNLLKSKPQGKSQCKYCQRPISYRQIKNHENKCLLRPADISSQD